MAEGVRIRHHTRRNEILPVPLLNQPIVGAPECGLCLRVFGRVTAHPCKTLHLQLDGEGAITVSPEIWAALRKTVNAGGFTVANPVLAPPTQTMKPPTVQLKIDGIDLGGELANPGPRPQIFTAAGPTRPDVTPAERTVGFDDYLAATGRLGVSPEHAINTLLAALLGLTKGK